MTKTTDQAPQPSNRGGARSGAGRKASTDPKGNFVLRITGEQRLKLEALGGAAWLRQQIDAAPWPAA